MTNSIFHPDFAAKPYWWEAAAPETGRASLPPQADVVVVGSGYCGLSGAIELGKAGAVVAVVDSGDIGSGASTRNGGMISGGLKLPPDLTQRVGVERAEKIAEEAIGTFRHLEKLIEREGLDAGYVRSGRFVAAHSAEAFRKQKASLAQLHRFGGPSVHAVPRDRQREEIGSDFYHGGLVIEEAGGLHPARYHRALCDLARRCGVLLLGGTGVCQIERQRGSFLVRTTRGTIRANSVFVATNGYTGPATPYFRRRLIPIASYMIATEALPADLVRSLSPNGRMFADTKRVLHYFRTSPDGTRILFGGRAKFLPADERVSATILYRSMCRIWPDLRSTRITHAWKGNVAFTFDYLPHIATYKGVHFAGGFQGNGVAMATYLGYRAGLKILNESGPRSAFDNLPFPTRPFYSGNPWFLPAVGSYYRFRDWLDQIVS